MKSQSTAVRDRYEWIDLARFFAAISVVLYHYSFRGWQHGEFFHVSFDSFGVWFRFGYLGVNLFFAISGFVILLSCDGKNHREFLVSRVVRLYPAYLIAVVLTWCVTTLWGSTSTQTTLFEMLVNLTMFQQFVRITNVDGVYWTLAREIIFYGMVYCFLYFRKLKHFELFLWCWLLVSALLLFLPVHRFVIYATNSDYSGFFAFGASLYFVKHHGTTLARAALVGLSFVILNLQGGLEALRMEASTAYSHPLTLVVLINSFATLILAYAVLTNAKLGALRAWGTNLGLVSYPLYLLHAYIGYTIFLRLGTSENKHWVLGATLLLSLALAFIVAFCWERPAQAKLRTILTNRFSAKA